MNHKTVVELRHVTKTVRHNKNIVEDVSFQINAGEVFGFLGPNGAEKTTTIRMMVGLIKISKGDIFINGKSITKNFKQAIRSVGAIVENPDLYKYMTGYQNLKHYARMVPGIRKSRIYETARLVGMEQHLKEEVRTYSLGMRQRLGLAQALLHRPSLVILDEPTNGLDPEGIHELRKELKHLAHEEGVAVLVSSHLLSEMQLMCDRVGVLKHGRLVTVQNIEDFVGGGGTSVCILIEPSQMGRAKILLSDLKKKILSSDPETGRIFIAAEKEEIPKMNKYLLDGGISVYSVQLQQESLEDRFLEVTEGKQ